MSFSSGQLGRVTEWVIARPPRGATTPEMLRVPSTAVGVIRPNDKAREPGTARARRKGRRAMATVRSPEVLLGRTSDGLEENEFFVCVHIHYNITCWIPLDLPEQTSADGNIFGAKTLLRAGHPPRKIFRHHDLGASFQPQHSMFVQTRKIPVFWAFWVPKLPKT